MKQARASSQWKVPLCVPTRLAEDVEKDDDGMVWNVISRGLCNGNFMCHAFATLTIFETSSTVAQLSETGKIPPNDIV